MKNLFTPFLASLLFCLLASFSGDKNVLTDKIVEGVGIQDFEIGSSRINQVLKKMDRKTQSKSEIDVVDYDHNHTSLTTVTYTDLGLRFQFGGIRSKATLQYVYLTSPFHGQTTKGVTLGESTIDEVESRYGHQDWKITGQELYKEYEGITFYVVSERKLIFTDLRDQVKLDQEFGDHKISKIILSAKSGS